MPMIMFCHDVFLQTELMSEVIVAQDASDKYGYIIVVGNGKGLHQPADHRYNQRVSTIIRIADLHQILSTAQSIRSSSQW